MLFGTSSVFMQVRVSAVSKMNENCMVLPQKGQLPAIVQMQEHKQHLEQADIEAPESCGYWWVPHALGFAPHSWTALISLSEVTHEKEEKEEEEEKTYVL